MNIERHRNSSLRMMSCFIGAALTLLIAFTAGCKREQSKPLPSPTPAPETSLKPGKTPSFKCVGCTFNDRYVKAFDLLKFANTDDFEAFFLKKRIKLSHVDGKSPALVMKTFRSQLSLGDEIPVSFYWNPASAGIGAWDRDTIKQNTKFSFNPCPLAAHLLHEVSHKYGWKHQGNKREAYDNLNSFPYAVGDEFHTFLSERSLCLSKQQLL